MSVQTKTKFCVTVGILLFVLNVSAEQVSFTDARWKMEAEELSIVEHLGIRALYLKGGAAVLDDVQLMNGVIEFDISVSEARGFSGALFRIFDDQNFEHFYIRPHNSGMADANQYTPVINGVSGWQLYHGEGYGSPVKYRYDEWMHIKIVYVGERAEIYIDSDTPSVIVPQLKHKPALGSVGVNASNFSPAYFTNFEVHAVPDDYVFTEVESTVETAGEATVMTWSVSNTVSAESLAGATRLQDEHKNELGWTTLAAEATGVANLAWVQGHTPEAATAFARVRVTSETKQVKGLSFGYSDSVSVYANDTLLYSGDNTYMTRDYRYLGTISLFDKVYVPLEPGDNEIWFAVTEAFGGWGIKAQFDDLAGIIIKK